MKDSKKILSEHKVSITNPRILVLEALLDNKNPLTIDELQSKLKNKDLNYLENVLIFVKIVFENLKNNSN